VEAGNDIRTALIGFGADASHAQERTHREQLKPALEVIPPEISGS
jgi:putative aminopeptidase FrvX